MAESTYSIYEDDGMNDDAPPPPTHHDYGDLIGDDQDQGDATAISPAAPIARATSPGTPPRSAQVQPTAQVDEPRKGGARSERTPQAAPEVKMEQETGPKGGEASIGDVKMGGVKGSTSSSVAVHTGGATEALAGLPSKVSSASALLPGVHRGRTSSVYLRKR
jgi:hypothetical protein